MASSRNDESKGSSAGGSSASGHMPYVQLLQNSLGYSAEEFLEKYKKQAVLPKAYHGKPEEDYLIR